MSDREKVVSLIEKLNCYLVGDITSMMSVIPVGNCGGCGYPLLQTIICGCELCGRLESGEWGGSGEKYYSYFITEYLPSYYHSLSSLYGIFRNTPAHIFITSVNINKDSTAHMVLVNDVLEINILELASDFIKSFARFKTKVLSSEGTEFSKYNSNINKLFSKLQGEARQISKVMKKDPEIQIRNYYFHVFKQNPDTVTASGIINFSKLHTSGVSAASKGLD